MYVYMEVFIYEWNLSSVYGIVYSLMECVFLDVRSFMDVFMYLENYQLRYGNMRL